MTRTDLTFPAGDSFCAAWLYSPDRVSDADPGPIIVMAHGLGGLKEGRLDAFERALVTRRLEAALDPGGLSTTARATS